MIHVSVFFTPDGPTLGDIRTLVGELHTYNVPSDTELLDGAHIHLEGENTLADVDTQPNVADLLAWVENHEGADDTTVVMYAEDLCVEVTNMVVEQSSCGEHVGELPANLYVTINPTCLGTCVD